MNCVKCNALIPADGIFCPHCGVKAVTGIPGVANVPDGMDVTAIPPPVAPSDDVPSLSAPPKNPRREHRRMKRRQARGFWYHPLTNLVCLALCAAGWFFIPREFLAHYQLFDFSLIMADLSTLFRYQSLRDLWDAPAYALIALGLLIALVLLSLLGLTALVRMIRRMAAGARRRRERRGADKKVLAVPPRANLPGPSGSPRGR